jgi:hypothetical protein
VKVIILAASVSALALFSCAPSTPAARIAAQPALFETLPARQQELVSQGRIDKGMGTDAVYLAWGKPSREYEGGENGAATLRWDYNGTTAVYNTGYYGDFGYGHGYGRYGRYGRIPYYGIGVTPEVTYLPYRRATVLFRGGRVSSWEKVR